MTRAADKVGLLLFAQRPQIGPIVLNCTMRETHGASYTITSEAIEDGSEVTDHRIENPVQLEIEGVISRYGDSIADQFNVSPTITGIQASFEAGVTRSDPNATAWARLRAYGKDSRPSQVITALEIYDDMLVESFTHDEDGRDGIIFTMVLKQVKIARVTREQYVSPDFEARAGGEDDLGQQGTRELTDQELEQVSGFKQVTEVAA